MQPVAIFEPFPLYAIPRAWAWMEATITDRMDDAAPKNLDEFLTYWIGQEGVAGRRSWAVVRDGEIGGIFFSNQLTPYVADLHVVFKKEFYGHKTTQVALAMVLEEIYALEGEAGVIKIESKILAGNGGRIVKGLVLSVGGAVEGIARGHALRDGEPIDVVMVGIERSKFNVWNRRRLQLEGHLERVSENGHDERDVVDHGEQAARAAPIGARHLRRAAQVPDGSAGGRQSGADRGA